MKIAVKETDETEYWLELCQAAKNYPQPVGLLDMLSSIRKILNKIISTSKKPFANSLIN